MLPPAGTVTVDSTRTLSNSARTVTVVALVAALRTGTRMVTSAVSVPGRSGSVVCTCGSPMTTAPVLRRRTWSQRPVTRSRTAGIQSHPDTAR